MLTYEYSLKSYEVLLNLRDKNGNILVAVRKLRYGPNYGPGVDTHVWGGARLSVGEWYVKPLSLLEFGDLAFAMTCANREALRLDELLPDGSKAPITNLQKWDIIELGKLV